MDVLLAGEGTARVNTPFPIEVTDMAGAGYLWAVHPSSDAAVVLVDEGLVPTAVEAGATNEPLVIGGTHTRTLTFQVTEPGNWVLRLVLSRPWLGEQDGDSMLEWRIKAA